MLEQIITDYVLPIVTIIGLIEFCKRVRDNGRLTSSMVMQLVFSFVYALLIITGSWQDEFTAMLVALIAYRWLQTVAMVTLFYDLVVKKIRDAGGKVKGE